MIGHRVAKKAYQSVVLVHFHFFFIQILLFFISLVTKKKNDKSKEQKKKKKTVQRLKAKGKSGQRSKRINCGLHEFP